MEEPKDLNTTASGPIFYVMVVGFHHKKGCLIEYCFPDENIFLEREVQEKGNDKCDENSSSKKLLDSGHSGGCDTELAQDSKKFKLPKVWKTLPSIALPDGAHNYDRDTIYFHLPHPLKPSSTVFGISCYRQIPTEKLHKKSSDVTRGTVQKSVVVLSELPLYGLIAAKCEMITYAYFNEFDFTKVDSLKELYHNLNSLLSKDHLNSSEVFLGLSPRESIIAFQHKILILFKLILLEKKVLFYKSPVRELCSHILTLVSLIPGMIETGGLNNSSTSVVPKTGHGRKFSGDIELVNSDHLSSDFPKKSEAALSCYQGSSSQEKSDQKESLTDSNLATLEPSLGQDIDDLKINQHQEKSDTISFGSEQEDKESLVVTDDDDGEKSDKLSASQELRSSTPPLLKLSLEDCGLPLHLFEEGSYCHPYLSITYLDVLSDPRVRSCIVGATNFLFKQKKDLFDVIVEVDGPKIEIFSPDLRKALSLTTQDLRFADFLVKTTMEGQVISKNTNAASYISNDGSSWEGCDDWLRYQFKVYLLYLLRTSECEENSKEFTSFNPLFMNCWKSTYNYKVWSSLSRPGIFEVSPGHPCQGQLSIADFRLKISQAVLSTERGKKLNQTLGQTSKAVGGAIISARSAVSSWWSSQWTPPNRNRISSSGSLLSSYSLLGLMKSLEKTSNEEQPPAEEEIV